MISSTFLGVIILVATISTFLAILFWVRNAANKKIAIGKAWVNLVNSETALLRKILYLSDQPIVNKKVGISKFDDLWQVQKKISSLLEEKIDYSKFREYKTTISEGISLLDQHFPETISDSTDLSNYFAEMRKSVQTAEDALVSYLGLSEKN